MARPTQGYKNSAGDRIPGTTTIIGRFKDSGALMFWAFKQGQSGVSHLYEKRDEAAESGTIAHDMIESFILNKPQPIVSAAPEIMARASNAFKQFCEWHEQSKMKIIATEHSYVSEKYQFGGTIDAIGEDVQGRIVLVDWKTSANIYQDYLIQLAAYALLLEECEPKWTPSGFHLLRVSKESADFAHYFFGELEEAKRSFILMRELYDLDQKLKKRVK